MDEQALAKACSQRDRLAEDELYRRYAARVFTLCRRYLGEDDAAKDLMLETLMQALDRIGAYHYQGQGSLYAWIPAEKLREWIAGLPEMRRAVFNLYCIDGYSHKEIGKLLGISEAGSTSMLAKARKQLKEKIRDYLKEQDR